MTDSSLEKALDEESRFWGAATRLLLDSGEVPYDIDCRRATKIRNRDILMQLGSRRADPRVEDLWRGAIVETTLDHLESIGAKKVLELGCGAGWLALEMARRGFDVEAHDISQERIRIAEEYFADRAQHEQLGAVEYRVTDLESFVPQPDTYDAIVSFTTLHHIRNKRAVIQRCYDALPTGGTFIVFDDDRHSGAWPRRVFRGLTVASFGLLLLPLPSYVPRRRRFMQAFNPLIEGIVSQRLRQQLRSLAAPLLWRGQRTGSLAKGSPFEGIHDEHDHASLEEHLMTVFENVQVKLGESFGLRFLPVINVPEPMFTAITKGLNALDQRFAASSLLPGTATFAIARKG